MQTVGDLMTPNPVVVGFHTSLAEVARELTENRIRQILVVDVNDGHLVGLLTAGELYKHGTFDRGHWSNASPADAILRAGDLAQPASVVVRRDDPLLPVLTKQVNTRDRVAIVVDRAERPIGILTQHDGVRLAQQMLAADSNPGLEDAQFTLSNGRYELQHILGQGGMATVYRAWDRNLDIARAIKVLKPEVTWNPGIQKRFELEARTIARLQHPNIVTVHDVEFDDRAFMVMELLERGSLTDWLRTCGPMPPRMATETVCGVLDGLSYAHRHGVVHRDVKPRNVLVTESGVPKLADFGIARVMAPDADRQTGTGVAMGTEAFMAPEQRIDASRIDERADVYAAAATLYALLTDRTPANLFLPERRKEVLPQLPRPLAEVIERATRYKPDDRYDSAKEMREALLAILDQLPEDPDDVVPLGSVVLSRPVAHRGPAAHSHSSLELAGRAGQTTPLAATVPERAPETMILDEPTSEVAIPTVALLVGAILLLLLVSGGLSVALLWALVG